jgi:hypothetical protein
MVSFLNTNKSDDLIAKWSRHQKSIKAKARFYNLFSHLSRPFNRELSNRICARQKQSDGKINAIKWKSIFGEDYLCPIVNIPTKSAVRSGEAIGIVESFIEGIIEQMDDPIHAEKKAKLKLNYVKGICAGIHYDIAERFVVQNEPLDSILSSLEGGAGSRAYALQMLSEYVDHNIEFHYDVDEFIEYLKLIQIAPYHTFPAFIDNIDLELIESMIEEDEEDLSQVFHDIFKRLQQTVGDSDDSTRRSTLAFVKQSASVMRRMKNADKISLIEMLIDGKALPGKYWINALILSFYFDAQRIQAHSLIARQLGMEMTPTFKELGSSYIYHSDKEYLKSLNRLKPGVYGIEICLSNQLPHVITLIREEGRDIIIDPNHIVLLSTTMAKTKKLLKAVIDRYGKENSKHFISIFRYDKNDISSDREACQLT